MSLESLRMKGGEEVYEVFRVSRVTSRLSETGHLRSRLLLDDSSGRIVAYCAGEVSDEIAAKPGIACEGLVSLRATERNRYAVVSALQPLTRFEREAQAISLLPRACCPDKAQPALDRLAAMVGSIRTYAVSNFLGSVFADETIGPAFLQCRASANHHHAFPGGLLAHSVAVAEGCAALARNLDPHTRDLTVAAGLLHDLGKIRTVGEAARPLLGHWTHHEAVTLEILAPHLLRLDGEWPEGGAALRHCLAWKACEDRRYARFAGADIVRACDGIDVASELGKTRLPLPPRLWMQEGDGTVRVLPEVAPGADAWPQEAEGMRK